MSSALVCRDVGLELGGRRILRAFDLLVSTGEFVCILGPSGCGKSTVLRLAAGLLKPQRGEVHRAPEHVGFVFQDPRLLPWLNVRENVLLPLALMRRPSEDPTPWLKRVGLESAADLYPHQLSGGMKQRAAIARALITRPGLLLMDEPFSALDEVTREDLEDLVHGLWREHGTTVLFVTHSLPEAAYLGQRILVMSRTDGRWIEELEGLPHERSEQLRRSSDIQNLSRRLSESLRRAGEPVEVVR